MGSHYILLGKSADLAFAEVQALCCRMHLAEPIRLSQSFCSIENCSNPQELQAASGSIVKVYEAISMRPEIDAIAADLIKTNQQHFALSTLQRSVDLKTIANRVKDQLKLENIKPHFRLLMDPFESAGITTKSSEYSINSIKDVPAILKAVAVQDLYYWTHKDYGRPQIDPHSGMMPPKIARTMINIALIKDPTQSTMYDPFCGSGTVLVEGIDLGCTVYGSDISKKAVTASQANCEWFTNKQQKTNNATVFEADVAHITNQQMPVQADAIIFEGYLGPPTIDAKRVDNIVKGMEKLYKGAFKHLKSFLKQDGYIVCALPEYIFPGKTANLDQVIDWTKELGYTRCARYSYGRPQAVVRRAIYVLQKVGK
jgi:tRNA G10  N-methylase Trm11